jgi:hypothetical protein
MLEVITHNQDASLVRRVATEIEDVHTDWYAPWETIVDILGEPENDTLGESVWWIRAKMHGENGYFALRFHGERWQDSEFYLTGSVRLSIVQALEIYLFSGNGQHRKSKIKLTIGSATTLPFPDRRTSCSQ